MPPTGYKATFGFFASFILGLIVNVALSPIVSDNDSHFPAEFIAVSFATSLIHTSFNAKYGRPDWVWPRRILCDCASPVIAKYLYYHGPFEQVRSLDKRVPDTISIPNNCHKTMAHACYSILSMDPSRIIERTSFCHSEYGVGPEDAREHYREKHEMVENAENQFTIRMLAICYAFRTKIDRDVMPVCWSEKEKKLRSGQAISECLAMIATPNDP